MDELLQACGESDASNLVRLVEDGGPSDVLEVARRFNTCVRDLYWRAKSVPAVVKVAQAGMAYCFEKAAAASDPRASAALRAEAKTMAANLATFTWPGWDEPGCAPTSTETAVGFAAAELNLRLGMELGSPAERVENAHWLLGAHWLAAGDPASALQEFELANPPGRALLVGYVLLARTLLNEPGAAAELDGLLATLSEESSDDANFAREQLTTARRVFAPR